MDYLIVAVSCHPSQKHIVLDGVHWAAGMSMWWIDCLCSDLIIPSLLAALVILFVCCSGSELFCIDDYSFIGMPFLIVIQFNSIVIQFYRLFQV